MASYHFYEDHANQKVICVSSYAGRKVKGVAKCDPNDTYNFEEGSKLAKARVDVKVADKRVRRASKKVEEARRILDEAMDYLARMEDYLNDSIQEQHDAVEELERLEDSL